MKQVHVLRALFVASVFVPSVVDASVSLPAKLQAELPDSFFDTTPRNKGGSLRKDALDVEVCTDTDGGYDLCCIAKGEWVQWSNVNVAADGKFTINLRVASTQNGTSCHINIDGVNVSGAMKVPNTGGWQNWVTITSAPFTIAQGSHIMRITMDADYFNINWIEFDAVQPPSPPPTPPAPPTPPVTVAGPTLPVGQQSGATAPAGALTVTPSTRNLAKTIASQSAGKAIYFTPGMYSLSGIAPKDGQSFVGAEGATIVNNTENPTFYSEASGVTLSNLTLTGGGPTNVIGSGPTKALVIATHSWLITNCSILSANSVAVMIYDHSVVNACLIKNYGETGVHGQGAGVQVVNCDIGFGNQDGKYPVSVEGGSVKFWSTTDGVVGSCYLHDNIGPGVWFDGTQRSTATLNLCSRNSRYGVQFEVSRTGTISGNLCEGNGYTSKGGTPSMQWLQGAAIYVETGYDCTISGNTIADDNLNGICIVAEYRPEVTETWQYRVDGVPFTGSIDVVNNTIAMRNAGARTGVVWDNAGGAPDPFDAVGNIIFAGNLYPSIADGCGFAWNQNGSLSTTPLTFAQWLGLGNQ